MTFFTPFMGGAPRLLNGNTLITEAAFGRIFEVTEMGEIVWEYVNPDFADYSGLDAKEIEGYFGYPANALLSHNGRYALGVAYARRVHPGPRPIRLRPVRGGEGL